MKFVGIIFILFCIKDSCSILSCANFSLKIKENYIIKYHESIANGAELLHVFNNFTACETECCSNPKCSVIVNNFKLHHCYLIHCPKGYICKFVPHANYSIVLKLKRNSEIMEKHFLFTTESISKKIMEKHFLFTTESISKNSSGFDSKINGKASTEDVFDSLVNWQSVSSVVALVLALFIVLSYGIVYRRKCTMRNKRGIIPIKTKKDGQSDYLINGMYT